MALSFSITEWIKTIFDLPYIWIHEHHRVYNEWYTKGYCRNYSLRGDIFKHVNVGKRTILRLESEVVVMKNVLNAPKAI